MHQLTQILLRGKPGLRRHLFGWTIPIWSNYSHQSPGKRSTPSFAIRLFQKTDLSYLSITHEWLRLLVTILTRRAWEWAQGRMVRLGLGCEVPIKWQERVTADNWSWKTTRLCGVRPRRTPVKVSMCQLSSLSCSFLILICMNSWMCYFLIYWLF